MTLSVSSWRRIWPRPAPSAVRIDISRDRLDARASIRFATLKHAMSSTIVTAPIIVRMMSVTSSGMAHSRSVSRLAPRPSFVSGNGAGEVGGDGVRFAARLFERHAVLQPGEHLEAARVALLA